MIVMRVQEEEVKFKMDVVGFYSKAMYRQIGEGCLNEAVPHPKLSSRALDEWKTGSFCPSALQ